MHNQRFSLRHQIRAAWLLPAVLCAFIVPVSAQSPTNAPTPERKAPTILFIGNSFVFASGSPVRFYRANTVKDLNGDGVGGVPALFKAFANQAGIDFDVSLETVPGVGIDHHLANKSNVVARAWDRVVMIGFSTLNQQKPGDPELLVRSAKAMAELLHSQNTNVDIRLIAGWSRADQTYPTNGHWYGKPIDVMAKDVRAGYDLAAASTPLIRGVIPVGEAWNRAIATGFADPNPYDGISANQIDLWTYDHYHASTFGYYLEALMIFGHVTDLDPRSLGRNERSALELGLSPAQAASLQQIAFDELSAARNARPLQSFRPIALPR